MQSPRKEMSTGQNRRDAGRGAVPQLEHDAVDLPDIQAVSIDQLLIQNLATAVHSSAHELEWDGDQGHK